MFEDDVEDGWPAINLFHFTRAAGRSTNVNAATGSARRPPTSARRVAITGNVIVLRFRTRIADDRAKRRPHGGATASQSQPDHPRQPGEVDSTDEVTGSPAFQLARGARSQADKGGAVDTPRHCHLDTVTWILSSGHAKDTSPAHQRSTQSRVTYGRALISGRPDIPEVLRHSE
ncbi:hypothetical protein LSH36_19g02002 [Paralvinella palmiformis]|uniref:Uncharacterized protein n=1 Tax=Paralvinella palmiformis TaxID=53620 RepID=A0AAD9NH87_9ANNE|nr:hypothetical protein LSH36_19g02002 [Paralvinella palmiformis]